VPIAGVFWHSGRTKVDGWNIFQVNKSALLLFENEFRVPLLSRCSRRISRRSLSMCFP
jgi:hypothetical protein